MTPTPIDLRQRFGRQYRIGHDEAHAAEYGPNSHVADPWLDVVLCRHGHIGPWGGRRLVASTNTSGPVANQLKALPCVEVYQDGSDGINVLFDVADFDQVAEVMQPRRRRRLSPEARAAAGVRLARYQFGHAVGFDSEARPCVPSPGLVCPDVQGVGR